MSMNKGIQKLLKEKKVFSTATARQYGAYPALLAYYQKKGLIERVNRGLYKASQYGPQIPPQWEDLVYTALSIPEGVICLLSALSLYEMTDEIPRKHWIAVSNDRMAPRREGIRIIRMRKMDIGRTTLKMGKIEVPIFDRERTVIDAFRYLSKEIAIKALRVYLRQKTTDFNKLYEYGKTFRTNIETYVLSLTA